MDIKHFGKGYCGQCLVYYKCNIHLDRAGGTFQLDEWGSTFPNSKGFDLCLSRVQQHIGVLYWTQKSMG